MMTIVVTLLSLKVLFSAITVVFELLTCSIHIFIAKFQVNSMWSLALFFQFERVCTESNFFEKFWALIFFFVANLLITAFGQKVASVL